MNREEAIKEMLDGEKVQKDAQVYDYYYYDENRTYAPFRIMHENVDLPAELYQCDSYRLYEEPKKEVVKYRWLYRPEGCSYFLLTEAHYATEEEAQSVVCTDETLISYPDSETTFWE